MWKTDVFRGHWYLSALLNFSKIHDALTISLCTTQLLKDPWRAQYISLHYSTSQRSMTRSIYLSALLNFSKIHDALTISLCTTQLLKDPWRAHYISLHYSTSQRSMTRSIYLSALLNFSKIHDALNRSLCIKSMTLSIYLLKKVKAAFSRFSYSFQIHDTLAVSVGEQHYSWIF